MTSGLNPINYLAINDLYSIQSMNQDEVIQLAIQKVKEMQVQAEEIAKGKDSSPAIQRFARHSAEVVDFIENNIPSDEIKRYLKELPLVNFKPKYARFWEYLLSPSWWIILYKQYDTKNRLVEAIRDAKHKYENLELLLKGLTG